MRLSDWKREYHEFSGKASDVTRQLAFAGIAIVWLFRSDVEPFPKIPEALVLPTGLLAFALASDLLHYVAGSLIWGVYYAVNENRLVDKKEDPELTAPTYCKRPLEFLFIVKIAFTLTAYFCLVRFVWKLWCGSAN